MGGVPYLFLRTKILVPESILVYCRRMEARHSTRFCSDVALLGADPITLRKFEYTTF